MPESMKESSQEETRQMPPSYQRNIYLNSVNSMSDNLSTFMTVSFTPQQQRQRQYNSGHDGTLAEVPGAARKKNRTENNKLFSDKQLYCKNI